jgi:hypothetical protein
LKEKEVKADKKKKKRANIPKFKRCYIALKNGDCGNLEHAHCFHTPADHWDVQLLLDADEKEEKRDTPLSKHALRHKKQEKERRAERQFYLDLDAVVVPDAFAPPTQEIDTSVFTGWGEADVVTAFPLYAHTPEKKEEMVASSLSNEEKVTFATVNSIESTTSNGEAFDTASSAGTSPVQTTQYYYDPLPEASHLRSCLVHEPAPYAESTGDERCTRTEGKYQSESSEDSGSESDDSDTEPEDVESDSDHSNLSEEEHEDEVKEPKEEDDKDTEAVSVKIYLEGVAEKESWTCVSVLISALGYLPGLDAKKIASDYEFTDLLKNTHQFQSASTMGLVPSSARRRDGNASVYWRDRPDSQLVSQLQLLYTHFIDAKVDTFVAKQVMLDEKLQTASFVSGGGEISRTVETSSGHILAEIVKKYPHRAIAQDPNIMLNTRMHVMNLCVLSAIMVARARPSQSLDFRNRVSSP